MNIFELISLNHVHICIPYGKDNEAREFYTNILKLQEIEKPVELKSNGGLWYKINDLQLHIGCEDNIINSKKHIAFEIKNINIIKKYFIKNRIQIKNEKNFENIQRFSIRDPFNNKIEFLEKQNIHEDNIMKYWDNFKKNNIEYQDYSVPKTDYFCNDEKNTNELAELVNKGIKTATCSPYIYFEINKEKLPQKNDLSIIIDWYKKPICIIKTKNIEIKKFKDISKEFAKKEGEGDLSLNYWKKVHKDFFNNYLLSIGLSFNKEMKLVCEEFEKIY